MNQWERVPLVWLSTQEFLPSALAFLAWLPCLALAWILLSHIGKIAFLLLLYKGWTNEKEYHFFFNQTSGTLSHWFIPYKVEGEKISLQCGTKEFKSKARQGNQAKKIKAKGKGKDKNSWVPTGCVISPLGFI